MDWKSKLKNYEFNKEWRLAIELMQKTISKNPNDLDAYLNICYLLMNILVEENYMNNQHDFYAALLKKYFMESYAKFSSNSEYLFYIGKIACIGEWYFDIEIEEAYQMMKSAANSDPENLLYKWANFVELDMSDPENKEKMIVYAKRVLSNPIVVKTLISKGLLGEYILGLLRFWTEEE